MKELIEKLNKLCEMDVAQSFRDEIASRDAAEREQLSKSKAAAQAELDNSLANGWETSARWEKDKVDMFSKYLGSRSGAKQILEYIYKRTKIDLQNGGIREIETPTTSKQLNQLVGDYPVILKVRDKFVIVCRSHYDNRINAYFVSEFGGRDKKVAADYFSQDVSDNGKILDLSKPNSLSKAVNNGLVQKAWEVYGPSTKEKREKRHDAALGNKDQLRDSNYYWTDRDKSGYALRDLKQELAKVQYAARQGEYNKMKEAAAAAKKQVFQKIKDGTLEDISTSNLRKLANQLAEIEGADINTYRNVDGQRQDQQKLAQMVSALQQFVNEL